MTERYEYVRRCDGVAPPGADDRVVASRPPEPSDAEALAALMLDAYRGTVDYDDEDLDDARTEVASYLDTSAGGEPLLSASRVGEDEDGLVGACLVTDWSHRDRPLVGYVMTRASAKRRGVGRQLLAEAVAALCAAGHADVRAVITAGNTPSERLFAGLGFERVDS